MNNPKPAYQGPAFLSAGFRPFFLGAALWAVVAMGIWLFQLSGWQDAGGFLDPLGWHIHGMIYGFTGAVIAGFSLTAIPNWTGRTPLRGMPLLVLFSLWLAARSASLLALYSGTYLGASILFDSLFLISLVAFAGHEVIKAGNYRNLIVVLLFGLYGLTGVGSAVYVFGQDQYMDLPFNPAFSGLSLLIILIMFIGGRIIPAFTNNWLKAQGKVPVAKPFSGVDKIILLISVVALLMFHSPYMGPVLLIAACANFYRLCRWGGWATISDPIVMVLHLSYLWIAVGFLLLALSSIDFIPMSTAMHVWTVGAIGGMTTAVMTRASLGHSGMQIKSSAGLSAIYSAVHTSVILRVAAAFAPVDYSHYLIQGSAILWIACFLGFAVYFFPLFMRKRS